MKISTSGGPGEPGNKKPQLTLGCERIGCYRRRKKTYEAADKKLKATSLKKFERN